MTIERLVESDPAGEVLAWLAVMGELLADGSTSGA
jgi:hypothetical protein